MVRRGFEDDLSSISCVSQQPSMPSQQAEENENKYNAENIILKAVGNGGEDDAFDNEYPMHSTSSPPLLMNGNETPPTELLLPKNRLRRIKDDTHKSWLSCCVPSCLTPYPPFLRVLFVACFACILCAVALLGFALIAETRKQSKQSMTLDDRNFDLSDLPPQTLTPAPAPAPSTNSNKDMFVADKPSVIGGNVGTDPKPAPTQPQAPTGASSGTLAPTRLSDTNGGNLQQRSKTLYPSPPTYPQADKVKKMRMGMGGRVKKTEDKGDQ